MLRRTVAALAAGALLALSAASSAHAIDASTLRLKLAHAQSRLGARAGAYVRDLTTGEVLYTRNPDIRLSPASNDKLLTTATALLRLGPDATLRTSLMAAAPPGADGVVHGDVVLVGSGDPYLTTAALESLAEQVAALGVTRISGRILYDASLLDSLVGSYDSSFSYDDDLGGRLSALQVDNGTGANPAGHAAHVLHKALKAVGIRLGKMPRAGAAGADAVEIAGVDSAPISTIIRSINVPSDNYAAELLLKDLGAWYGSAGTTAAGTAVVTQTMRSLGLGPTVVDGSGLSRSDRVTARQIARLLTIMNAQEYGPAFAASLPVAGRDGTLKDRMTAGAAHGRCAAKTGTLRDVSALSGYCTTTRNHTIVFSFIANGICSACGVKTTESAMVTAIARYTG